MRAPLFRVWVDVLLCNFTVDSILVGLGFMIAYCLILGGRPVLFCNVHIHGGLSYWTWLDDCPLVGFFLYAILCSWFCLPVFGFLFFSFSLPLSLPPSCTLSITCFLSLSPSLSPCPLSFLSLSFSVSLSLCLNTYGDCTP